MKPQVCSSINLVFCPSKVCPFLILDLPVAIFQRQVKNGSEADHSHILQNLNSHKDRIFLQSASGVIRRMVDIGSQSPKPLYQSSSGAMSQPAKFNSMARPLFSACHQPISKRSINGTVCSHSISFHSIIFFVFQYFIVGHFFYIHLIVLNEDYWHICFQSIKIYFLPIL